MPTRTKSPSLEEQRSAGGYRALERPTKVFSTDLYDDGYSDPVYQAKARILNDHIQEIGMGKYQVCSKMNASFSSLR